MRALVLEDSQERIEEFFQRFIEKEWDADIVETAAKCIDKLKTVEYDIVFLDHDLGGEVYVNVSEKNTGSEVARFWNDDENINKEALVVIHSYNPTGAEYMQQTIKGSFYLPSIWIKSEFDRNINMS